MYCLCLVGGYGLLMCFGLCCFSLGCFGCCGFVVGLFMVVWVLVWFSMIELVGFSVGAGVVTWLLCADLFVVCVARGFVELWFVW